MTCEFKDIAIKTTKKKIQRREILKSEQKIYELWENYEYLNIHVIGIPEKEKSQKPYLKT